MLYISYYCTYDRAIRQKYSLLLYLSIKTLIFVITSQVFILLFKRKRGADCTIPGVKGPCRWAETYKIWWAYCPFYDWAFCLMSGIFKICIWPVNYYMQARLLSNREIECFTHGMIIPQYTLVILFYRDVEALSWFYERYLLFPANYIIVPIVLYIVSYVIQKLFIRVSSKAVSSIYLS